MILDAESLELVNAIEAMLEPAPAGEIKPELMESVLEISTDPCADITEAGDSVTARHRQHSVVQRDNGTHLDEQLTYRRTGLGASRRPVGNSYAATGDQSRCEKWRSVRQIWLDVDFATA